MIKFPPNSLFLGSKCFIKQNSSNLTEPDITKSWTWVASPPRSHELRLSLFTLSQPVACTDMGATHYYRVISVWAILLSWYEKYDIIKPVGHYAKRDLRHPPEYVLWRKEPCEIFVQKTKNIIVPSVPFLPCMHTTIEPTTWIMSWSQNQNDHNMGHWTELEQVFNNLSHQSLLSRA